MRGHDRVAGPGLGHSAVTSLHVAVPFGGLPGTIFVAFIGAVILLAPLRLFRR